MPAHRGHYVLHALRENPGLPFETGEARFPDGQGGQGARGIHCRAAILERLPEGG